MALFSVTEQPTPFGAFDDDDHFIEDANAMLLYIRRRLGDDVMSVELTNKQIWANFEEAVFEFSKHINASQAASYMSNLLGLSTGFSETFKKDTNGRYYGIAEDETEYALEYQDLTDPRFRAANYAYDFTTGEKVNLNPDPNGEPQYLQLEPVVDKRLGPHGKEQTFPRETLEYLIRRAEPYATEAAVGGAGGFVRGYIELKEGVQDYNVYEDMKIPGPDGVTLSLTGFNGDDSQLSLFNPLYKQQIAPTAQQTKIKIQEVYHFSPQAAYRFFDTTSAINYLNNQFAFESFTPETVFYVLPVFEDLLRASQLDISNRVRRSNYSYRLQGSELRIFPRPTSDNPMNLFIRFGFPSDPYKADIPYDDNTIQGVSNISNIPFGNIKYANINSMSRQWIRQYTLALCKETLGMIRSKFSSVPIPGSDLQMNGSELMSQGREDKTNLITAIKETLEGLTYQKILEADSQQSDTMATILKRIPVPNGRAIIIG
jgi:hypothetical protein